MERVPQKTNLTKNREIKTSYKMTHPPAPRLDRHFVFGQDVKILTERLSYAEIKLADMILYWLSKKTTIPSSPRKGGREGRVPFPWHTSGTELPRIFSPVRLQPACASLQNLKQRTGRWYWVVCKGRSKKHGDAKQLGLLCGKLLSLHN